MRQRINLAPIVRVVATMVIGPIIGLSQSVTSQPEKSSMVPCSTPDQSIRVKAPKERAKEAVESLTKVFLKQKEVIGVGTADTKRASRHPKVTVWIERTAPDSFVSTIPHSCFGIAVKVVRTDPFSAQ